MPNKKTKKKTNKQKEHLFKKYQKLLNLSLHHYYSNDQERYEWDLFTDEDFSMIMKDIQYGIRKGWELLQSNKKIIELHCHSLCCSVALVNYEIYKIGDINKITDLERLYLFFLYYLTHSEGELPLDVSLKKQEQRKFNILK